VRAYVILHRRYNIQYPVYTFTFNLKRKNRCNKNTVWEVEKRRPELL